jgi:acetylornithine/N-succinyldiaminopimelate aminotransferase
LADEHGALLLVDEVQTGLGRTGTFLAYQGAGVAPDAVALAKGLGGGFPMGAMLCREKLAEALPPGTHGSTFGGNPLASAAALAVLAILDDEKLAEGARVKGEQLGRGLSELASKYADRVGPERGRGLLRALPLRTTVAPGVVIAQLRERGVLLTISGDSALRFTPPLVVTTAELDEGLQALDRVLAALPSSR